MASTDFLPVKETIEVLAFFEISPPGSDLPIGLDWLFIDCFFWLQYFHPKQLFQELCSSVEVLWETCNCRVRCPLLQIDQRQNPCQLQVQMDFRTVVFQVCTLVEASWLTRMTKILDDQGRPVLHPCCKTCQAQFCTQAPKFTSLLQSVSTIREVVNSSFNLQQRNLPKKNSTFGTVQSNGARTPSSH